MCEANSGDNRLISVASCLPYHGSTFMTYKDFSSVAIHEIDKILALEGHVFGAVEIPTSSASAVTLPFAWHSAGHGPLVTVIAGLHGNEWNSIACVAQVATALEGESLLGHVLCLPVLNLPAFRDRYRNSISDQVDMNRVFDTFPQSSGPTSEIAMELWNRIIKRSDYVLDFHSAGDGDLVSQVRICSRKVFKLAASFMTEYVQFYDDLPNGFLIKACDESGIQAFGIELGKGLTLEDELINQGINGVKNFLRAIGVLSGRAKTTTPRIVTSGLKVQADQLCLFWPKVTPGQLVKKGSSLGEAKVLESWSQKQILAACDGTVLYVHRKGAAAPLDTLIEIVGEEHVVKNHL